MNKTLVKTLLRLIRTSLSRFLAVAAIVGIGVAFFTGVSGSSDIMAGSVDTYSDETRLKDITLYSNYGFDDDDVEAVGAAEGVQLAEGAKFTDVIGRYENDAWVTRIHSLKENQQINHFILAEGRMPANEHEALGEKGSELVPGYPLGARIEISMPDGSMNENLKSDYFIITGLIDTPLYLNEIKENSTLSNQFIKTYLYVNDDAFEIDYYTEMNVLCEDALDMNSFSKAYEEYCADVRDNIKELAKTQESVRCHKLRDEAYEEYEKGMDAYNKALQEFEDGIAEAEKELAEGEQEIKDGEEQLAEGEKELAEGIDEYNKQKADAEKQLADALALLNDSSRQLSEKESEFAKTKADLLNTVKALEEGIAKLNEAKEGLAEIDRGLAQIEEAKAVLYDEKTVLLIDLLRQLDQDIPLEDLMDVLARLNEAQERLEELFPEIADLPAGEVSERISEAEETVRSDAAYLESEEIQALIDELRALDPETPLEESEEEIPAELTAILSRYNPFAEMNDAGSLVSAYDSVLGFLRAAVSFLDSDVYEELSGVIASFDADETVADILSVDAEELREAVKMLEEETGRSIETTGDLVNAYDETCQTVSETEEELLKLKEEILAALAQQDISPDEIDANIAEYENLIKEINDGLAEGERQLAEARAALMQGYSDYESGRAEADALLSGAYKKIAEGQREIDANRKKLEDAREALRKGYENLEKGKAESLEELADARRQLEEGKEKIDAMDPGEWMVLDRKSHYASATYHQTVDQMRAIGRVFPLFFILVAALVCLTTMSRMVSEQRGEIGTLRALGYTKLQCASKYLIYAGSATLIGCVIGSFIGLETFPRIIYNAWRMLYILPPIELKVPWKLVLSTAAMFIGAMLMTTWLVIRSDMREVPSQLMRPKSVPSGRQTFIEKIGFLWNRLSFTWKVTLRNIFRYRRRFIMTVIGVAGCCALMVTGFGIRDSINSMVDIQFDEIQLFEGTAGIDAGADEEEKEELIKRLEKREDIASFSEASVYSGIARTNETDGLDNTVTVHVFDEAEDVKNVYVLRTRKKHVPVELDDEGIVISEHLSENLGVKKGDTFRLQDEDGNYMEVRVSGICELYIYHEAYMTEAYYEKAAGKASRKRALFIHVNGDTAVSKKLQSDLMEESAVSSVDFYDEVLASFTNMVKSLDLIVWTLIFSSMALAFVVLGNLININVSERQREIATLKVLGFRRKEVQSYIFKENNILTVLGTLAGLPVGNYLHHYIMGCIELDMVMYGRSVKPQSFLFAMVFTIAFGMAVNRAMSKNLDQIAMVESLKSVE